MAKGLFEKVKGSDVWWIRYADQTGRIRYEKAGTKGMAEKLYRKRKVEALQVRKLPETIRRKMVLFKELVESAVVFAREHHQTNRERDYRADLLVELLGNLPADSITPQEIDRQLSRTARDREWAPASYNRFKAFVSLAFRLGIENSKVTTNPARFVRRRHEDNAVIRWLTADEETKLRAAIQSEYPDEVPAMDFAAAQRNEAKRTVPAKVGSRGSWAPPDHHLAKQAWRHPVHSAGQYGSVGLGRSAVWQRWPRPRSWSRQNRATDTRRAMRSRLRRNGLTPLARRRGLLVSHGIVSGTPLPVAL